MRAKEFLSELNMAPGTLAKFASTSPVIQHMKAGFEAEMIVLGKYDEGAGGGPDYDQDATLSRNVDTDDVHLFFELGRKDRMFIKMVGEYEEWVTEWASGEVENNIDDRIPFVQEKNPGLDEESVRNKAWEELFDEFMQDAPSLYEFFYDQGIKAWSDIAAAYNFDWPYMKRPDNFVDEAETYSNSLQYTIGATVKVLPSYHSESKSFYSGDWYIEPDGSIKVTNSDEEMGIEVVSPPMHPIVMLQKLQKTLMWARENNAKTNNSTSLQVGISLPGQSSNLDYVKLVLFLGDKYILDRFGRAAGGYNASSMDILQRKIAYGGKNINASVLDQMKKGLTLAASRSLLIPGESKSVSVHMRPSYVEFRSMGSDYLSHFEAIQATIMRYIRAYAVASDPMAERQEYFKKLSKMLNPSGSDQLVPFVQYAAGQINKQSLVGELKGRKQASPVMPQAAPEPRLPSPEEDF